MRQIALGLFVAALALGASGAQAWRAVNQNEVFALGDGRFEVVNRPGTGPAQYWCAAGDFARHVLDLPGTRRLYVHKAVGPSIARPGARAVQFALTPPPDASDSQGYSLSIDPGANLSAAFAHQYCLGQDRFDRFPLLR